MGFDQIDHLMVDFADEAGGVHFANPTPIPAKQLDKAKKLAKATSRKQPTLSAYVVAFDEDGEGLGHIGFYDGRISDYSGVFDVPPLTSPVEA